jgi:3-hydroxyisobutyrate dehydrogenase-like beta-hydroxyacid dehydrogenase
MADILFVGLGKLGHLLVGHLVPVAAERDVTVWVNDIDPAVTEQVAAASGARPIGPDFGGIPSDVVLCLCVPNAAAVTSVVEAAQAAGAVRAGSIIADFSSLPPVWVTEYAAKLAADGVTYLDTPLTGGIAAARTATMVTIAGGDKAAIDQITWIAEAFSEKVVLTGKSGNGALLKTINNWIGNSAALAAMEGIIILRDAGLSNEAILEVLNNGPAATYFSASRYPRFLTDQAAFSGAELGLVTKDLHIAAETVAELGATPVASLLARDMWRGALAKYGPGGDMLRMLDYVATSTLGKSWDEVDATGTEKDTAGGGHS